MKLVQKNPSYRFFIISVNGYALTLWSKDEMQKTPPELRWRLATVEN